MMGRDVVASSITGSGKTAAFLVPVLQRYFNAVAVGYIRTLIVTPTRELAIQVYEQFEKLNKYTRLEAVLVIGASSIQKQESLLRNNPEVVIGTPGCIIDMLINSRSVGMENLQMIIFISCKNRIQIRMLNYSVNNFKNGGNFNNYISMIKDYEEILDVTKFSFTRVSNTEMKLTVQVNDKKFSRQYDINYLANFFQQTEACYEKIKQFLSRNNKTFFPDQGKLVIKVEMTNKEFDIQLNQIIEITKKMYKQKTSKIKNSHQRLNHIQEKHNFEPILRKRRKKD